MKKMFNRFIASLLVVTLFCLTGTVAMAAEQKENNAIEVVQRVSDNAVVFSLGDYGNKNQTALLPSGSQPFTLTIKPTKITYIALSNGGANAKASLSIQDQYGSKDLICDGQPHELATLPWAINANEQYTCKYTATNIVSISIVFHK